MVNQHIIENGKKRQLSEFAQYSVDYLKQHPECDEVVQWADNIAELDGFRLNIELEHDPDGLHLLNSAIAKNDLYFIEPQTFSYWLRCPLD